MMYAITVAPAITSAVAWEALSSVPPSAMIIRLMNAATATHSLRLVSLRISVSFMSFIVRVPSFPASAP